MYVITSAVTLHVLAAVLWVGGMFFAYVVLRPTAASQLEAPVRLRLWAEVFRRFFPWVWASVVALPATGYAMIFLLWGGMAATPISVHLMNGLGTVMILIYLHVFFAPYRRLRAAVAREDWQEGGRRLGQIRTLVGTNTVLGLVVIAIAAGGRYLPA